MGQEDRERSGFERLRQTPVLGLGLGIDVHSAQPDWRELLRSGREHFDFLEVYTRGEADLAAQVVQEMDASGGRMPVLYHHENLDPAYPGACAPASVEAAAANVQVLEAHWCVEELAYRQVDGRYLDFFAPALLTDASIEEITANVRRLQAELPCPLVPENPPYQLAVGKRHVLELLGALATGADCGVVLDLGHLYSFQLCVGLGATDGLEHLPLERVVEVHLAGARVENRDGVPLFHDLHGAADIPPVCLDMAREICPQLPNLKAVTIEVEDASVEGTLEQARQCAAIPVIGALREAARGVTS